MADDAGDDPRYRGDDQTWSPLEPGSVPPEQRPPPPPPPPGYGAPPPPYGPNPWGPYKPKAGDARTGPLPLHPMNLSDILDGAFKLYKANAKSLILITAAFVVPIQLAAAFFQRNLLGGQSILTVLNDPATARVGDTSSNAEGIAQLVVYLASILIMPFVAGAISRVVAGSYLGHRIEPSDALRATGRRWWALTAAWFLVHILEALGFLFCILPGLLLMALFVAVAPAIVVEELGPIQGMRRSARLLKPRIWHVLGIALLAGLLASFLGSALGFIPQVLGLVVGLEWGWLLVAAGSILVGIVTTPFVAIVSTLLYFDGRIRWEGFDLAVMAGDMARRTNPYGAPGA
jgi:MFS family permease